MSTLVICGGCAATLALCEGCGRALHQPDIRKAQGIAPLCETCAAKANGQAARAAAACDG